MALLALAAFCVLVWVQAPAPSLYGYDGPYHIRAAAWLREQGVQHTFPWWQETFLKDHWADKDFLYHVALIPFTFGDLEAGGRAASLLFGTLSYLALGLALWGLGAKAPALWAAALLLGSTSLLYRFGLLRSHVPAIAIALLGTAAILRGRRWSAALASAVYAWTHIAWHLLPAVALAHAGACLALRRRPRWTVTLWVLAGTAAAILANPFFPDHLRLWRVQIVDVLRLSWTGGPDVGVGTEVLPGSPRLLVLYAPAGFAFTAAGLWTLLRAAPWRRGARGRTEQEAAALTLAMVTLGFLALSLLSRRFVEFWVPFSALFAATASAARGTEPAARAGRRPLAGRRAAAAALVLVLAALGWHNVAQARRIIGEDRGMIHRGCAGWIRDHVPAGETVFTTDWDEFPQLFLFAPEQHYLVGLDPTFMYVTSPDRWRLWRDVAEARAGSLRREVTETFGARFAFADAWYESFIERADQEPGVRVGYADPECRVYEMQPSPDPRLPAPLGIAAWRMEGGGSITVAPGDFVDVARAAPSSSAPCARLDGALPAPAPPIARFHLFSDDAIQVSINGALVYDTRAPRPAPTLDEIVAQQQGGGRHPDEHIFETPLGPGYNEASLRVCRAGVVWGFHLEIER